MLDCNYRLCWLFTILAIFSLAGTSLALPFENDITKGNRFYHKKMFDRAGEFYSKAVEKKKSDIATFNLGNSQYKQGRFSEAERICATIPQMEKACYNQGNSCFKQGNYQNAIDAYTRALKIDPNDRDATYNLKLAKKMLKMQKQQKPKKDKQKQQQQGDKEKTQGKGMSKEDAEQILQGISSDEKHKGREIKGKGAGGGRDW
ncbi:tetratricopeptide repeat protein [Candidatus Desantisbacteria bacterium]|nr:tetratricopeptide repeat protein [Candidatus Desantisbacteria bacterium]